MVIEVIMNSSSLTYSGSMARPSRLSVILAFLAIYLIWGTTYLAIRYVVETIPPLISAAVRHSVAGLILLGLAWWRGFRSRWEHWRSGLILGGLFFLIGHGCLHWSEQYVSSGLASLLIASEPLWILLMGAAMGQQKINWKNGSGLLLGLAGVAVLSVGEISTSVSQAWGAVAVLAGAASWALGVCISPRLRLPGDALGRSALPLTCGAVLLFMASFISGEFSRVSWNAVSSRSLLGLAFLIVFGSVLAFSAYTWLLQHCSSTLVATHSFVNPLVAVLIGWLLADEALSVRLVLATAVILAAIVLIQRADRHADRRLGKDRSA